MKKYISLVSVIFILGCGGGSNTDSSVDKDWKCFCDNEIKTLTAIKNNLATEMTFQITDIKANQCTIAPIETKLNIGKLTGYGYDSQGVLWAEITGVETTLKDLQYNEQNFTINPYDKTYVLADILLPYSCYTDKVTIEYDNIYGTVKEHKKIVVYNSQYDQSKVYKEAKNDPLYKYQWHLKNTGQDFGLEPAIPGEDINVEPVWDSNITGKGVTIGVIDTGMDMFHPDLKENIDFASSYNYHNGTHNTTPGLTNENAHATAVAGLIAAKGWNGIGTRGVAPNATIASLNALEVTEDEAQNMGLTAGQVQLIRLLDSLTRNLNTIDIFNNSWGGDTSTLTDDISMDIDSFDTQSNYGVKNGRKGLGVIYVKSAGNSGKTSNSNFEQISTNGNWIVVGAVGSNGKNTEYSTPGSSILVSAPGGGVNPVYTKENEVEIVTTDLSGNRRGYDADYATLTSTSHFDVKGNENYDYTNRMNGTSAAAPITSGVIALMLEANPNLSYRDIPIILAKTARKNDPEDSNWKTNAAGLHFNYKYGFGVIDADAAVKMAKTWTSVGNYNTIKKASISSSGSTTNGSVELSFDINDSITVENAIIYLTINNAQNPNQLKISLISPSNTESVLVDAPNSLTASDEYNNTRLLSKNFIEENAKGTWKLKITSANSNDSYDVNATLKILGH
ncbi:S8 family serine peptidase [Caminibacter pacificus]